MICNCASKSWLWIRSENKSAGVWKKARPKSERRVLTLPSLLPWGLGQQKSQQQVWYHLTDYFFSVDKFPRKGGFLGEVSSAKWPSPSLQNKWLLIIGTWVRPPSVLWKCRPEKTRIFECEHTSKCLAFSAYQHRQQQLSLSPGMTNNTSTISRLFSLWISSLP